MSSYWAGYSDTCMVLTDSEFREMMKQYEKKNPRAVVNEEDLESMAFVISKFAGTVALKDRTFHVTQLSDSFVDAQGVVLSPIYRKDGTPNISADLECKDVYPMADSDRCYFLSSDKCMTGAKAFEEKPYDSYQDFVQEFKDKAAGYLPDDFNWNAHLGNLYYAVFA